MNCEAAIIVPSRTPRLPWLPLVEKARRRHKPRIVGDMSGNLKLKNINSVVGSTSSPTTSSTTFATVPEMTVSITTKGNKVLLLFSATITCNNSQFADFQFFRDGVGIGEFIETSVNTNELSLSMQYSDSPSAASHTFDVRWSVQGGALLKALGVLRQFQVVELG